METRYLSEFSERERPPLPETVTIMPGAFWKFAGIFAYAFLNCTRVWAPPLAQKGKIIPMGVFWNFPGIFRVIVGWNGSEMCQDFGRGRPSLPQRTTNMIYAFGNFPRTFASTLHQFSFATRLRIFDGFSEGASDIPVFSLKSHNDDKVHCAMRLFFERNYSDAFRKVHNF